MSKGSEVRSEQAAGNRGKLRTENSELRTGRSEILPKGWITTELGKIVLHRKGKKPEKTIQTSKDGYIPYILIDEMEGKAIRAYTDDRTVPIAKEKDILIVWDGSIGKTATGLSGAIGSTIAALTPIVIPSNFLETFLKLSKPTIEQTSRGTGLQHINQTTFWPLSFPLPPLNEQNRIVAKLDQIMPRIDAVKERLNKVPAIIKRFRQSVLTAAVTGKLTEKWREKHPDVESAEVLLERIKKESSARINIAINYEDPIFESEWNFLKLGVLFSKTDIFDGPFGSNLKTSDYVSEGVRVIRLENIEFLSFNNSKKTYVSKSKYESLKRHAVFSGDIIFSSFIMDNVRTVVLPELNEQSIAKADCFCLRTNKHLTNKQYLTYILSSQQLHDYLQSQVHGATRPRINTTQLKATPIPYPPLKEQKEIVRQVDKFFALADRLETHYRKAKARVDKLSQSVLAKAFRGELVITEAELAEKEGRDFESAEKLMERILEEKAKLVGSRQRIVGGVRSARGSKGKQKETGGKKK